MRVLRSVLALATCAALLSGFASAAAQQSGALAHGGSYVLREDPTIANAAVELWFRAPSAGYDGDTPGLAQLAATAAASAKLVSGTSLANLLRSTGGQLSINVYPDMVAVSATTTVSLARRVVAAMTAAYFAPTIDADALKAAQRDAAVRAVERRYSPDLALQDALFGRLFASGPASVPPLPGNIRALTQVPLDAVNAFAKRAFRSSNALLTLAGNVDDSLLSAVTDGSGSGAMDRPFDSSLVRSPKDGNVEGSVGGIGLAWVGPAISDERASTALDFVCDYLFRQRSGTFQRTLEKAATDVSVSGLFITLHDPGVVVATISGDGAEATQQRLLAAIAALQTPMDTRAFDGAREAFIYHIESDAQTPQTLADNLGWYATQGNAAYAPGDQSGTYVRIARSLDPQYVAQVVRKFLSSPVVVHMQTPVKEPTT